MPATRYKVWARGNPLGDGATQSYHVGVAGAMLTSLTAVARNPVTMAAWGIIVAVALALGSLPFFLGLAVVIPVLGHSTWHLYRKVVEPDHGGFRPEYRPRPKGVRYAAEFPASLFFGRKPDEPRQP